MFYQLVFQVSRSIGDVYLKKPEYSRDPLFQPLINPITLKHPVMTAEPSILRKKLEPEDLFLIFASDGLWEQLSDQAVVEIVSKNPRSVSLFYCCINHSLSHTCFNNRLVTLTACRLTGSIWQKVVGRICWLVGPAKISHLFKPANCYGNV